MGKMTFASAAPFNIIESYGTLLTYRHSSSAVTLLDGNEGMITLRGKGLVFNEDKEMVAGTITGVTFGNVDGAIFANYSGNVRANSIQQVSNIEYNELWRKLFAGDDIIFGSNDAELLSGNVGRDKINGKGGNDLIYGDTGNDRMTGGKGSDIFYVGLTKDSDVITDFDAKGGEGHQDFLHSSQNYLSAKQKGHDLLVDFGNGDRVLLLDVAKRDFDQSDFAI